MILVNNDQLILNLMSVYSLYLGPGYINPGREYSVLDVYACTNSCYYRKTIVTSNIIIIIISESE